VGRIRRFKDLETDILDTPDEQQTCPTCGKNVRKKGEFFCGWCTKALVEPISPESIIKLREEKCPTSNKKDELWFMSRENGDHFMGVRLAGGSSWIKVNCLITKDGKIAPPPQYIPEVRRPIDMPIELVQVMEEAVPIDAPPAQPTDVKSILMDESLTMEQKGKLLGKSRGWVFTRVKALREGQDLASIPTRQRNSTGASEKPQKQPKINVPEASGEVIKKGRTTFIPL